MRKSFWLVGITVAVVLCTVVTSSVILARKPASPVADFPSGKVQLMSAGPLAFGPDGVLFVGDSVGGAIAAIDTQDTKPVSSAKINVDGIDVKIAAMVGVPADQIVINDVKVNPISKNVYVSASRGRGPDAAPLIMRIDASGNLTAVALDNVRHESVSLVDAPANNPGGRGNPRMQTITDMNYVNGNVIVAGLSNEEWASALRSIPFPFNGAKQGATLQIWHSSHGRYETESPIRTFVPYTIGGQAYILAGYTCTPLVKIPVSSLTPGAKVKGEEIADLGMGNQPLDMVPYKKDGHDYILIANSSFGVLKLRADNLQTYPTIAEPTRTDVAGVPFDKISSLQNVRFLAKVDDSDALVVTAKPGSGPAYAPGPAQGPVNVQTIALP